jgi:hypothetical protein
MNDLACLLKYVRDVLNDPQVTAPCALYWAQSDWLVVPEDAAYLKDHLPNVVLFER